MSARRFGSVFALACASVVIASCNPGPVPAKDFGEQLFNDARFADSKFNAFSCATCHSVKQDGDAERILSGHTLYDVTARPNYWGGQELRLIDSASFCFVYFMRGAAPLDPEDPKSKALYEYLQSISPDDATGADAKPFTVVKDIVDLPAGDAKKGESTYKSACQSCHGELHSGNGRLTDLASRLPEIFATYPATFPNVKPRLVVIEKVRHGQFFGVGGNMPLYGKEMLSDEQLSDLLAYLGL